MAKIIYKKGKEGQNTLSSIEGIEIELRNGQTALIYPKYDERQMLTSEQISKWSANNETEFEALNRESTALETECLREIGSPAAQFVSQFKYGRYINFYLPSLLAALEIQNQKKEIDALAETIEGADLLRDHISYAYILSCSREKLISCWCVNDINFACSGLLNDFYLVVPTILYR